MNKRILLLLLTAIIYRVAYAQSTITNLGFSDKVDSSGIMSEKFAEGNYYSNVRIANHYLHICERNNAAIYLRKAFQFRAVPYANDVVKYLYTVDCQEVEEIDFYLQLLRKVKGVKLSHLKDMVKHRLCLSQRLHQLELDNISHSTLIQPLRDSLVNIMKLDQQVRDFTHCGDWNDKDSKLCFERAFRRRDQTDSLNAIRFLQVIDQYGFPTEDKIGVYLYDGIYTNKYSTLMYLLGIHFSQTKSSSDIYRLYLEAEKRGDLHPEILSLIHDFQYENFRIDKSEGVFMSKSVSVVDSKYYKPFVYYSDSLAMVVDSLRSQYELEQFETAQRYIVRDLQNQLPFKLLYYPMSEEFPNGLVKAVFAKEGVDLSTYLLPAEHRIFCDFLRSNE